MDVKEEELQALYQWVDEIPLSRPKRHIARDFSDGVLIAEIVAHYYPKLVDLHNYSPANSFQQKLYNWNTLNVRVLKKLNFSIPKRDVEDVCNCVPMAVERVLKYVQVKIARNRTGAPRSLSSRGGADTGAPSPQPAHLPLAAHPAPHPQSAGSHQHARPLMPSFTPAPTYPLQSQQEMTPYPHTAAVMQQPPQQQHRVMAPNGGMGQPGGMGGGQRLPSATPSVRSGSGREPPLLMPTMQYEVNAEILADKEATILELRETNELLETKIRKLEQLVRLKDVKIQTLTNKLREAGLID